MEKHSIRKSLECASIAFVCQVLVALLVMWLSPSDVAAEQAKISTIFAHPGMLSKETLLQFLVIAVVVALIRFLFMSDCLFRNARVSTRTLGMFGSILVVVLLAVWKFRWFHATQPSAWIGFILGFGICFGISVFVARKNEDRDNDEMNDALRRILKEQEKNEK